MASRQQLQAKEASPEHKKMQALRQPLRARHPALHPLPQNHAHKCQHHHNHHQPGRVQEQDERTMLGRVGLPSDEMPCNQSPQAIGNHPR